MKRDTNSTERLRREITRAIVLQTGTREQIAMEYADAVLGWLQREFAGDRLYVPHPPRQYDLLQIEAALSRGESPTEVARKHGTTVRQLRRLFRGGLPGKRRRGG